MLNSAALTAALRLPSLAVLLASAVLSAPAQSVVSDGGNQLLEGVYNFRQVVYITGDPIGNFSRRVALSGTMHFDGAGNYVLNGTLADSGAAGSSAYNFSGNYSLGASGHGWISSPLSEGVRIEGAVAQGVFIGSSSDSGYNDLLVAALAPADGELSAATISGSYRLAYFDVPAAGVGQVRSAWMSLEADGAGGTSGATHVQGYFGNSPSTLVEQSISGAQYTWSASGGQITFPTGTLLTAQLVTGSKTLYAAHGGDLLFGGSSDGFDLFIGIRLGQTPGPFSGLYFEGGLYEQISAQAARMDSYYGAFVSVSSGAASPMILGHQRIHSPLLAQPYDFTYRDDSMVGAGPDYGDSASQYALGVGGFARLGAGKGPLLGIRLAVHAPELSGEGVFVNPMGILNGASFAPFTSGASPGTVLTLFGNNLAPSLGVANALPFPSSLEGVQVVVNGQPAPLYLVSAQQISLVLPLDLPGSSASLQVVNNGQSSNTVEIALRQSSPGVFTNPALGYGLAAALHLDYSLLSADHPALPGETIAIYLTGLGPVSNAPAPGAPATADRLSTALEQVSVFIGGEPAVVSFAGLAPTLAGLYQINVEIPANAGAGQVSLDVAGPDSYTAQTFVPVDGGTAGEASPQVRDSAQKRLSRFLERQTGKLRQ